MFILHSYPFQPRPPHHSKCTCSVSPPPASRWVGRLHPSIVVTDTSSATHLPIRPRRVKTKNGTRCKTSQLMCPATFWMGWRNGQSTRFGSKHTQMLGPVLRAAAPASERKRTVILGFSLLLTCSLLLLTETPNLPELILRWKAWFLLSSPDLSASCFYYCTLDFLPAALHSSVLLYTKKREKALRKVLVYYFANRPPLFNEKTLVEKSVGGVLVIGGVCWGSYWPFKIPRATVKARKVWMSAI